MVKVIRNLVNTAAMPLVRWTSLVCLVLLSPAIPVQTATLLQYGQPISGTLNAGQSVDYTFNGRQADKPAVIMNGHGGSITPHLALFDSKARLIAEDSGSGQKGDALLKGIVLAEGGIFTVRLSNQAPSGSGKYTLLLADGAHQTFFDGSATAQAGPKQDYQLAKPWDHTNVTFTIANSLRQFNAHDVNAVLLQAFQSWANVTPLKFAQVSGHGDINIKFAAIDGPLNILGETCPPSTTCAGDMILDDAENWTLGTPDPGGYQNISLLGVASHELGHAIGLLHTNDTTALMYPEYSPYALQPTADDVAGAQRLYGPGAGVAYNPTAMPGVPPATNGQMAVSGQIDNNKFAHFWDFDVQAGAVATITMHRTSGDLDAFLILVDANNNVIAYDDDSGSSKDAQLRNINFPSAGTYTVIATRYAQAQGYTAGAYSLSIQYGTVTDTLPATKLGLFRASWPTTKLVPVSQQH